MKRFYGKKNQTRVMRQIANKVFNKHVETKHSVATMTDGIEIAHNNFYTLDSDRVGWTEWLPIALP
jgi:hypothetical protein